jgi:uncharacterized protein
LNDADYKRACFQAYNRWIAQYCEPYANRLIGLGQSALRSPQEGIADLHDIKALGLRGLMMPGEAAYEHDYDHEDWNPFWEAAIELQLPLSFHILTMNAQKTRGARINFVPVDRPRLSGHHGHADLWWRVRTPSIAEGGVCRS